MTLKEAVDIFDSRCENDFSLTEKIKWISNLDGLIKTNIIDTHEGGNNIDFLPYSIDSDKNTKLLVPEPFAEIYIFYMLCQAYLSRSEFAFYENAASLYNNAYYYFATYYNRTHLPKQDNSITGYKG